MDRKRSRFAALDWSCDLLRAVIPEILSAQPVANPDEPPTALPERRSPNSLAIHAQDVWLRYPLGAQSRASLKSSIMSMFGHREAQSRPSFVNALKGVTFDISHGEKVALIGHNGSGKSTLLRALAGIYPLHSGDLGVRGQIGTLLEIGLGFEAESTGRENIYNRGMTMGYSRRQLQRVEQDIVAFADLGEFIDLPMRTYSAGMSVRLGFAISTHFSPDILLVDEVFGAGDAAFAKRAVARMTNIVQRAGIFIIATHDTALIERVCDRVIWLEQGMIVRDGPTSVVLPEFLAGSA